MHDDVTKLIEAYRDSFGRGPGAVAEFYAEPCLIVGADGARVHQSRHDTERFLGEVGAGHRTRGFTRADIFALDVQPLGAGGALATVRWGYLGACEELLGKATVSYNLHSRDGVWKIVVETTHDS
jgi:hypothetical protein